MQVTTSTTNHEVHDEFFGALRGDCCASFVIVVTLHLSSWPRFLGAGTTLRTVFDS